MKLITYVLSLKIPVSAHDDNKFSGVWVITQIKYRYRTDALI